MDIKTEMVYGPKHKRYAKYYLDTSNSKKV